MRGSNKLPGGKGRTREDPKVNVKALTSCPVALAGTRRNKGI
jgi:hypothetical protein